MYVTRRGSALAVSNSHSAQQQLRGLGYEVSTLPTSMLRFSSGQAAYDRLLRGSYQLVWADAPGSAQSKDARIVQAFWTAMAKWAVVCRNKRIPLYICGPRSSLWKDDRARNLIADGLVSESSHRFCHYGIKYAPGNSAPSQSTFVLYSTHPVPSHLCRCAVGTKHCRDWLKPEGHTATTRLDAVTTLYRHIMATSGFG